MNLIPLSHSISSMSTQKIVPDTYVLQRDILERLHNTVQLSGIDHKHNKLIRILLVSGLSTYLRG